MNKNNHSTGHQQEIQFPLLNFRRDMEHLFDDFFRGDRLPKTNSYVPKCNIFETEKSYHIEVELPGMSSKAVDLSLNDNVLTIKGEPLDEHDQENKHYYSREFSCKSVRRAWELPTNIEAEKLEATFESGILKIELPKKQAETSKKKITIKEKM